MLRVGKLHLLELPEESEYRLTHANEFRAPKRHHQSGKTPDILPHWLDLHPMQPAWMPYHPAHIRHASLAKPHENAHALLATDARVWALALANAREREVESRIEWRRSQEQEAARLHAERWVQGEVDRRRAFQEKVAEIARNRTNRHVKAKQLQLAFFDFVRQKRLQQGQKEADRTRQLIADAAEARRLLQSWRLDDLWLPTVTGGARKAKGYGIKLEAVIGKLLAKDWDQLIDRNWEWRRDNLLVTLPNGGMIRAKAGTGHQFEHVAADIWIPDVQGRTDAFQHWRATNTFIETPNGSLVRLANQGRAPEDAEGALELPKQDARTAAHYEWRQGGLMQRTPNGGFAPLPNHGQSAESVTAEQAQPVRDRRTEAHSRWHAENLSGPTPNGGFAPLAGHGQSVEKVSADHAQPDREARTEGHENWRLSNRYALTPNHGYARLENVGHSLEQVSAKFTDKIKNEATGGHDRKAQALDNGETLAERLESQARAAPSGTASNPLYLGTLHAAAHAAAPTPEQTDTPALPSRARDREFTQRSSIVKQAWKDIQHSLAAHDQATSELVKSTAKLPEARVPALPERDAAAKAFEAPAIAFTRKTN